MPIAHSPKTSHTFTISSSLIFPRQSNSPRPIWYTNLSDTPPPLDHPTQDLMVSTHIALTTSAQSAHTMRVVFLFLCHYMSSIEWHWVRSDTFHLPPDALLIKTIRTQIKPPHTLSPAHLCRLITVQSAHLKI